MPRVNKICGIYKITSPSRRVYIGQSVDCTQRLWKYKSVKCINQPRIYNSIKKYGWDKHVFEIIHRCEVHELNALEIYYVELFNSTNNKCGLNLKSGGGSTGKFTEESRIKMSNAQKKLYASGYIAPATGTDRRFWGMYGKKHSEKTKKDHSERMKGRPAWNKGIPNSEEQRRGQSERMKGKKPPNLGVPCSEETKRKISETKKRNHIIKTNAGII